MFCSIIFQSCSSFTLYENAFKSYATFLARDSFTLTPQIVDMPFAMNLGEHDNSFSVIVLAYEYGDRLVYYDGEGASLTFLQGKIISSSNLQHDFDIVNPPKIREIFTDLINNDTNNTKNKEYNSMIRFQHPDTAYLRMTHRYSILKSDNKKFIKRLSKRAVDYNILEEIIEVPLINWKAYNYYWFDKNAKILRSKQSLNPSDRKYFVEVLKEFEAQ